jgi:hypothetical protein
MTYADVRWAVFLVDWHEWRRDWELRRRLLGVP